MKIIIMLSIFLYSCYDLTSVFYQVESFSKQDEYLEYDDLSFLFDDFSTSPSVSKKKDMIYEHDALTDAILMNEDDGMISDQGIDHLIDQDILPIDMLNMAKEDATIIEQEGDMSPSIDMMIVMIEDDSDHDGFTIAQGDCNDENELIYPNAPEIFGDHIDQDCDSFADRQNAQCQLNVKLKLGNHSELQFDTCGAWIADLKYIYYEDQKPQINEGTISFKHQENNYSECILSFTFKALSCGISQVYQVSSQLNFENCDSISNEYQHRYQIDQTQGLIISFDEINTGDQFGNFSQMPLFTKLSGHLGTIPIDGLIANQQAQQTQAYLYGSFSLSSTQVRSDAIESLVCQQVASSATSVNSTDKIIVRPEVSTFDQDLDGEAGLIYGGIDCSDVDADNMGSACHCGDKILSQDIYEECDDGNQTNLDGCSNQCYLSCRANCPMIDKILIEAGSFNMGSTQDFENPIHPVDIQNDFYVTKSEITVGQYRNCVNAGHCTSPNDQQTSIYCNWTQNIEDKEDFPLNCIDWNQARKFARWLGADLLTEAQWEYVATSQGQMITYPWGNDEPRCDLANFDFCIRKTSAVCSTTMGNTFQGVCDMSGNVLEWVLDEWHFSYEGAPMNELAWCQDIGLCNQNPLVSRVFRGGAWDFGPFYIRSAYRYTRAYDVRDSSLGFRIAFPLNFN